MKDAKMALHQRVGRKSGLDHTGRNGASKDRTPEERSISSVEDPRSGTRRPSQNRRSRAGRRTSSTAARSRTSVVGRANDALQIRISSLGRVAQEAFTVSLGACRPRIAERVHDAWPPGTDERPESVATRASSARRHDGDSTRRGRIDGAQRRGQWKAGRKKMQTRHGSLVA